MQTQAIINREEIMRASTCTTPGDEYECQEWPLLLQGQDPRQERRVTLRVSVIALLMELGSGDLSRGIEAVTASKSASHRRHAMAQDY